MFIDMKRWAKTIKKKKKEHTKSNRKVYSISALFSPNISKIKNSSKSCRRISHVPNRRGWERAIQASLQLKADSFQFGRTEVPRKSLRHSVKWLKIQGGTSTICPEKTWLWLGNEVGAVLQKGREKKGWGSVPSHCANWLQIWSGELAETMGKWIKSLLSEWGNKFVRLLYLHQNHVIKFTY